MRSTMIRRCAAGLARALPPVLAYPLIRRCDRFIRGSAHVARIGEVLFPFLPVLEHRDFFYGWFEPEVQRAIHEHLPRGGCFADVGANDGFFTAVAAAKGGPDGRYFAFEPNVLHFNRLSEMASINAPRFQIQCIEAAVMDFEGTTAFFECNHPGWHTTDPARRIEGQTYRERTIPCLTLDAFAEKYSIETIDLLKIDVEGAEEQVLKGAQRLFKEGRIKSMIIELHHPGHAVAPPLVAFLKSLGWSVADAKTGGPVIPQPERQTSNALCLPASGSNFREIPS